MHEDLLVDILSIKYLKQKGAPMRTARSRRGGGRAGMEWEAMARGLEG